MIHISGQWDYPRRGSSGSDGQFPKMDEALLWTANQQFDTATLHDDSNGSHAVLEQKNGVWGFRFSGKGAEFVPLVDV